MKKMLIGFLLCMFLIGVAGLVAAENENMIKQQKNMMGNKDNAIGGQKDEHGCLMPAGYSWNSTEEKCVREWENGTERYQNIREDYKEDKNNSGIGLGQMIRNRVKAGIYTNEEGDQIRVSEMANNRMRLMAGNRSADCEENCNLSEEKIGNRTRLRMHMSNGNETEIKIMPDKANERALERLKLKFCNETNNCTIQLREVGKGKKIMAAYEIQVERHKKLFGFFKIKAIEKAQVDAETGESIVVKKPWWAFLATNSD